MARIVFYGKPSCGGNARQRAQLLASGHELEVRDLFTHPWTRETLAAFLDPLPPTDWFNRSAVKVKSGEVVPERTGRAEAMALLLADPPLIRRPLMEIEIGESAPTARVPTGGAPAGGPPLRLVGWDAGRLDALIGLAPVARPATEACIAPAPGGCHGAGPAAPAPAATAAPART